MVNAKAAIRLLAVCNSRLQKSGSLEDFMIELARQTSAEQIQLSFLFHEVRTKKIQCCLEALNAKIYEYNCSWESLLFVLEVIKLVVTKKVDIIDFHFCSSFNCFFLFGFLQMIGKKIIFHYHGEIQPIEHLKFFNRHFSKLRLLSSFINKVVCVSFANTKYLEALNIKRNIVVIYNGVTSANFDKTDRDFKKEMGYTNDEIIVTTIGSLIPRKGIDILLRAACKVSGYFPQARFIIVGGGDRDRYQRAAKEIGLANKVVFTGLISEYPLHILKATDLYVSSSFAESFGLSIAEAQLVGVPVVATRVGGVPEVVDDGNTGILVPAGDYEALAAAIITVLSDISLRQKFSKNGKNWIVAKFGMSEKVVELIKIYRGSFGETYSWRHAHQNINLC